MSEAAITASTGHAPARYHSLNLAAWRGVPEDAVDLIEAAAAEQGLKVTGRGDGYGPSDQTSFYAAGIPVLHLFTGSHEQYHSPEDKAATLNAEGAARIAELTAVLASHVARGDATPVYARASAPPAREGDSRGYGAYLGTVPDYRFMEQETGGVLLADNVAAFRLEVTPEQVKNMNAMLDKLREVVPLSDDDVARFNLLRRNKHSYQSIPLRLKLSEEEIARFAVNRWAFPGVDVVPYLTRSYPLG